MLERMMDGRASDRIVECGKEQDEKMSAASIHTAFMGHRSYVTRRNPYSPGSKK
jgi:hypothetical protein